MDIPDVAKELIDPATQCPLTSEEIVELCISLVKVFNAQWMHLYGYQETIMRRIISTLIERDGSTTTAILARQSGKSSTLAALSTVICLALPALGRKYPLDVRVGQFNNGVRVGIFAPKDDKTKMIFDPLRERAEDPEVKKQFYASPSFGVNINDPTVSRGDRVGWSNKSFVVTRSASPQTNNEGDTFHVVIIDEAQGVPAYKIRKEISPTLSSTMGPIIMIGTADMTRGAFYDAITYNLEMEQKDGIKRHFEYDWKRVCQQKFVAFMETKDTKHLNYEKKVKAELASLYRGNEDALEFKLNYRLLWHAANLGAIDREAFDACADNEREADEPRLYCRQVAGLDLGKTKDPTVLTINEIDPNIVYDALVVPLKPGEEPVPRFNKCFIAWHVIQLNSWLRIVDEVVSILARYMVDTLVVDSTGVGDPIEELIKAKAPYLNVVSFKMSTQGNDLVYKKYIVEIDSGRQRYVAGPETRGTAEYCEFVRQHEILQKVIVGGTYISCRAPEGDHEDFADSGALASHAADLPVPDDIASMMNPMYVQSQMGSSNSREDRFRQGRTR